MAPNAKPGPPQSGLADNTFDRHHSSQEPTPMQAYVPRQRAVAPARGPFADLPSTRAHGLPPVIGRTMWAIIVLRCVHCGSGHVHRSGDTSMVLSGRLIRRCPATKLRYRLGPMKRHNEARRVVHLVVAA